MRVFKSFMLLVCTVAMVYPASAPPGIRPDGTMDRTAISGFYFDGDFDRVTDALETFRKQNPQAPSEDMIFVYKYLSVVYAADESTREKGESYMYQLLKLVPSVELIDMYISDNIKAIFNSVKRDYHARLSYLESREKQDPYRPENPPAAARGPGPGGEKTAVSKRSPFGRKWIWWAGGGAGVAAAVTFFFLMSGEEQNPTIAN